MSRLGFIDRFRSIFRFTFRQSVALHKSDTFHKLVLFMNWLHFMNRVRFINRLHVTIRFAFHETKEHKT